MWLRVTAARALGFVLVASVVVLGAALLSQYVGGLQPCVLCLYQRVPYALTIAVSGVALVLVALGSGGAMPVLARGVLTVCGLLFLIGSGIAAYHVGVEQGWWLGTEACAGPDLDALSIEDLREQLLQAPIIRCDEVAWSLFGVSMAGYNFLVSFLLAVGCMGLVRLAAERAEPA